MNKPRRIARRRARAAAPLHTQQGAITVMSAVSLLTLVAVGALAIEVGQMVVARNELQNAADATALAGAACLAARVDCDNLSVTGPDWTTAVQRAQGFVSRNAVQGRALSQAQVDTGYWAVREPNPELLPTSFTPTVWHYPAVRVTIARDSANNGGPLFAPLAHLLGATSVGMRASAVALMPAPGTATPTTLFPVAMSSCMYNTWWDAATGTPRIATATDVPGLDLPQVVGEPYRFKMSSAYHSGPCESGRWTSLSSDRTSAADLRQLITEGNRLPLSLGDATWLQPGTDNSVYNAVDKCSEAGDGKCAYVMVPVVDLVDARVLAPIRGFACLRILSAKGGNDKYIEVQMSADEDRCPSRGEGVGPDYGISTPPRLVR